MIEFLVHSSADNVGVVVTDGIQGGQELVGRVLETGESLKIGVVESIPLGHKIAVVDIEADGTVVKYGHDIGRTIAAIGKGHHVHVHNLRTKRW